MKTRTFKIAILGDGGVGKTSLIRAKCHKNFDDSSEMTIGVDFACVPFEENEEDEDNSAFLAFDLGGQQRFHFIHDAYIKGTKAAIILYDLSRFQTFDNITTWHKLLQNENPRIPIIIAGTKADLVESDTILEFQSYWEEIKSQFLNNDCFIDHLFVSAKSGKGLNELFEKLQIVTLDSSMTA
ncbi:hypothetical protein NEF87_002071 [Candidatus Lokiarchaeum ossiferum]|uniref:GTP-binding protein n=1 Tax=Candidatus Lokiarchaeum ossiferum TaxID=2951803 RepID=A0ABY6HQU3_9ARCH|nr:hypothetical protein NEF87_002071 [Candidatus Lokiarchaeum sp. B-35]